MSEDPETARQITELSRDTRPLLVLDVDEVVLEFITPFMRFLGTRGLELTLNSFRLHGNIVDVKTGIAVEQDAVSGLLDGFFCEQRDWQTVATGAVEAVSRLATEAEVVMLTAMPHRHRAVRRQHLDALGFPYPLLTTEKAKGPALRQLRGETNRPVAFVDDITHNLVSVRAAVSDAHLFNLMAYPAMRPLMPPLPDGTTIADDWNEVTPKIATALGF